MDLSAELRNEIYELALTEEDGITLVTRTKQLRRRVARGTIKIEQSGSYFGKQRRTGGFRSYWRVAQATQSITTGRAHRQLSPDLLAVSKQIREEGSSILYRQDLIFEDMMSLHAFIAQIGTYNQKLVTELTVKSWSDSAYLPAREACYVPPSLLLTIRRCRYRQSLQLCWPHQPSCVHKSPDLKLRLQPGLVQKPKASRPPDLQGRSPSLGSPDGHTWHSCCCGGRARCQRLAFRQEREVWSTQEEGRL